MKRAYLDSNVLIAAATARAEGGAAAAALIDNQNLELVVSAYVVLETYPPAVHNKRKEELRYYDWFFTAVDVYVEASEEIAQLALTECKRVHGLAPLDALHLAAAYIADADELVTLEREEKPLFRSKLLRVRRLE